MSVACSSSVRFTSQKQPGTAKTQHEKKRDNRVVVSEVAPRDSTEIDRCVDKQRGKIIKEAETWLGTPYLYGGETRDSIDCSSLVQHVFGKIHIKLPRTAAEQQLLGKATSLVNAKPGDLLFFTNDSTGWVSHVGIYAGNGMMIHASATVGVTYQKVDFLQIGSRFGEHLEFCGVKKILGPENQKTPSGGKLGRK